MNKVLITSGCSFTETTSLDSNNWQTWPIHLYKILENHGYTKFVNCAGLQGPIAPIIELENEDFTEVFIDTPLDVCEKRDPKGLYRKARAGLIPHFTGIDDEYEPPLNPDIVVNANLLSVEEAVDKILAEIS
jgi:preprotein translocase subunit Sec61beta